MAAKKESPIRTLSSTSTQSVVLPDGGWGWMVVLGSALAHFLVVGMGRSFGVFFTYLIDKYQESSANTAWIIAIHNTIRQCLGPLVGVLCDKFTCRAVVMVGGLVMCVGFVISAWATSVLYLYITFGLIAGLGGALIFTPSYVIIGEYFDKKKGKAMAIATMGSGLGSVLLAPILTALLAAYNFFGAILITGAIMLNNCVAGALYRPLRPDAKSKSPTTIDANTAANCDGSTTDGSNNHEQRDLTGAENVAAEVSQDIPSPPIQKPFKKKLVAIGQTMAILSNITFVLYGLEITAMSICIQIYLTFLPGIAEEYGSDKIQGALLLSIVGVSDMAGRFMWGFFFDLKAVRKRRRLFHCLLGLPVGGLSVITGFMTSYYGLGIMAVLWGLVEGGFHSQRASAVSEFVPRNEMAKTVGFVIAFQGIGNMLGPPVAGFLRDETKSFAAGYIFGGVCLVVMCLIFLTDYSVRSMLSRRQQANKEVEATA